MARDHAGVGFQFLDLPPGTYRVEYELAGCSTLVRSEIRLTTGFAARVDVVMKVAAVAETVIVSGASPAAFVTDTWRPLRRLTVNAGLRLDRSVAFVPPQTKVQGPFGNSGDFARVDIGTWTRVVPRIGGAFDVTGDGRMWSRARTGCARTTSRMTSRSPIIRTTCR